MKLSKAFNKFIVIFTVLLLFSVSCFSVVAYSPNDLIHNDILHLPYLPTNENEPYSIVFTMKEGTGDIFLYTFGNVNNLKLRYGNNSSKYFFSNSAQTSYSIYKLNENFAWDSVTSGYFPSSGELFLPVFVSSFSSYGMYFLNVYYINFDLYFYRDGNVLINSPSTLEYPVEFVENYDDIFYEPVPEGWFDEIMQSVSSFVGGLLDGLVAPLEGIANALNSMWNEIKSIPQAISDKLEYLFVPSGDKFDELKDKFDEKFGFVSQIIELGETIINATFGGSKPNSNVTIYGGTYTIIDWDIYDDYRPYIHGIIVLLSYIVFIPKLIRRLPSIIRGI